MPGDVSDDVKAPAELHVCVRACAPRVHARVHARVCAYGENGGAATPPGALPDELQPKDPHKSQRRAGCIVNPPINNAGLSASLIHPLTTQGWVHHQSTH